MKLTQIFGASLFATALTAALPAFAITTSVTFGATTSEAAASTITFGASAVDNFAAVVGNAAAGDVVYSGSDAGVAYTYTDGALFSNTTLIRGVAARPPGSTGDYYSVGKNGVQQGVGTVTFSKGLSYFGFLWGSPDTYNSFSVFSGSTLLGTFDGTAIKVPANGDQSYARFFNVFAAPGQAITSVTFTSHGNAFETDNHAFTAMTTAVPEPETYAMLLAGLGLLGAAVRRKKSQ